MREEGTNEKREDELRQGQRVYEIQGTKQAGNVINLRRTHRFGGTIQMTEQETPSQGNGNLEEQTPDCLTDEDEPDFWEALVVLWAGTSENEKQEADIVTATKPSQSDTARSTAAISEAETVWTPATDTTRALTENVSEEKSETEKAWHSRSAAGKEESKEKQVAKSVGKKRFRRRRSQLDDLITGAPSAPQGKRTRSTVDYTSTLDKARIPAKKIRTLPGARHQQWRVGYGRSTINKVLAPGQDAG
jgi:hypothetical protein